jgi:hypothetical protein
MDNDRADSLIVHRRFNSAASSAFQSNLHFICITFINLNWNHCTGVTIVLP